MYSYIIVCRYCHRELATLAGSIFRDGRWAHRACYNAAHDEAREAHVGEQYDQYKRDKNRMEVENNEG